MYRNSISFGGQWGEYFVIFGYYLYVEIVSFGIERRDLYYIKSTSNTTTTTSTPYKIQYKNNENKRKNWYHQGTLVVHDGDILVGYDGGILAGYDGGISVGYVRTLFFLQYLAKIFLFDQKIVICIVYAS